MMSQKARDTVWFRFFEHLIAARRINPRLTFLSWNQIELTRRTILSHKFCPWKNELSWWLGSGLSWPSLLVSGKHLLTVTSFLSIKVILPVLRTSGAWFSWRLLLTNEVKHLRASSSARLSMEVVMLSTPGAWLFWRLSRCSSPRDSFTGTHISGSYIVSSFSGIIQSCHELLDLAWASLINCSFLCVNTDDIFPEKMRASCSRTILSTNSLLVRRFPCSSLIADRLPFFLSDLLTNAQNCPGCGKKI